MRGPTLNEARRADREIMDEVLKWVSKGKGSVMAGLAHYANNTDEPLWKLLSPQPEGMPDQGLEKHHSRDQEGAAAEVGRKKRKVDEDTTPGEKDRGPRVCIVCKKRHEPRCVIPPGFRKDEKAKRKAAAQAKKGSGKDKAPK